MQMLTRLPERVAANITWKENYLLGSQISYFIFLEKEIILVCCYQAFTNCQCHSSQETIPGFHLFLGHSNSRKTVIG